MTVKDQTGVRFRSAKDGEWFVHPDLYARMVADADEKGTNLGDLAIQILCQRFKVEYTPNQRKSSPSAECPSQFNFYMPPGLESRIAGMYPKSTARQTAIRQALCAHYGLAIPARVKRTRNRRPVPRTA